MFESSLASLYRSLNETKEKLSRLKEIEPNMENLYQEFILNYPKCMEPGLSSDTWKGKVAASFDENRELEIKEQYGDILSEQFPVIFLMLENKTKELIEEMDNLYRAIADIQAEEEAEQTAKKL